MGNFLRALKVVSNLEKIDPNSPIVFCFLRIETTGTDLSNDELLEIALVKYSAGKEIDRYHSYVRSIKDLSDEVVASIGLDPKKWSKYARDKHSVLEEVKNFFGNSVLVGHNSHQFELPFLNSEYLKLEKPGLELAVLDTLLLSKALEGGRELENFELSSLVKKLEISVWKLNNAPAELYLKNLIKLWKVWESQLRYLELDPYSLESLKIFNTFSLKGELLRQFRRTFKKIPILFLYFESEDLIRGLLSYRFCPLLTLKWRKSILSKRVLKLSKSKGDYDLRKIQPKLSFKDNFAILDIPFKDLNNQ
ncbi:DNA polymerase III polC-type [Candidatus Mycoplasma haematolamae str. Purdue]|uniref:DNA polymerase III polC-type n=1 Tax=Mycoplasma haematolamae (strain Purdue) TaxID=1212765 RepID=I7C5J7_MYCHA|nr:3'-5' exonuclease [Candidatus Mycoplasma haematolamae]AFO51782.1 DNA polymerase III polC-type [Candidatus Mycoplasma haematolamae str. Purdue]